MDEEPPIIVDMHGNPLPDPIIKTVHCGNEECSERGNRITIETYPDSRIVCGTCGRQITEAT